MIMNLRHDRFKKAHRKQNQYDNRSLKFRYYLLQGKKLSQTDVWE